MIAIVVAGIVAPVVAGCATVPSNSAPRPVLSGANAVQAYVRPLPPPPPQSGLYKTPIQTVLGFLYASATYAYDSNAAKQFLSPALSRKWLPGPVTVVSSPLHEETFPDSLRLGGSPPAKYATVTLTVQQLATLNGTGQYEFSAGTTSKLKFTLAQKKNAQWLIIGLPQGGHNLLLTQASFQEVYQPRNLFFFARQEPSVVNGELVPDPVYAPLQSADSALNLDVVRGLVNGLLNDQNSWLSAATMTAFPRGTKLLKVALRGQVAVIDLGGTAARASWLQKRDMYAQLLATLTSNAYSNPLAGSVVMQINGRPQYNSGNFGLVNLVSRGPLLYQSGTATVSELGPRSSVAGPAQLGSLQITALAATTSASGTPTAGDSSSETVPAVAVAVADGAGCAVEMPVSPAPTQPGGQYKSLQVSTSGGPCTSLSWDRNGNLWAVAGGHVMQLPWRASRFLPVSSPSNLPLDGKSAGRIISLQMAPDGVRAALLVKTSLGNRVLLAAVTENVKQGQVVLNAAAPAWTGLRGPIALSWSSPYNLVVLTKAGIWQVPLTGGAGRLLGSAPAGAVSLASDGVTLVVGTDAATGELGTVYTSSNGANSWKRVAFGAYPTYPTLELGAPVSGAR
ncbi:MAG TPA: LpqB family beta-propeller domain-containing protein [Streptosporangiaceae bacterium]|nr:LpqB family beta-propeller domain-containing protein [Streptosporangiaceae bacterium]